MSNNSRERSLSKSRHSSNENYQTRGQYSNSSSFTRFRPSRRYSDDRRSKSYDRENYRRRFDTKYGGSRSRGRYDKRETSPTDINQKNPVNILWQIQLSK